MQDTTEVKRAALEKILTRAGWGHVRTYSEIYQFATTEQPLNADQLECLHHYINTNNRTLRNTRYLHSKIFSPVRTLYKTHKLKPKQK